MSIRQASFNDIDNIMKMITVCIKDMESQGIYQWIRGFYPTRDLFEQDIENGSLYLLEKKGKCLGVIAIDEKQSPEYEGLDWYISNGKTLVIHRLAVDPNFQKQGIGSKLISFAENFAINKGYTSIRLDTYSGNSGAIKLYERRGYKKVVGELYFPRRELPFYCYEKII